MTSVTSTTRASRASAPPQDVVAGSTNLDDFGDLTGVLLPDGDYETVAGFVMARLGHVPEVGDAVQLEDVELRVTEMAGPRVTAVTLVRDAGS